MTIDPRTRPGRSRFLLTVLTLLTFAAGCSDDSDEPIRAAVEGKVHLDGQPLEQGVIRFVPVEPTEGPQATVPIENGQFEIESEFGPVVGTHRVEIESTDNGGYALDDEDALEQLRESKVRRIEVVTVPPVYNTRSQLEAVVKPDEPNHYEFQLEGGTRR